MSFGETRRRPSLIRPRPLFAALLLHLVVFVVFYLFTAPSSKKETVIPIELTFEAPPEEVAEEPPPPAPVSPKVETPSPPPADENLDAVVKVPEKPKPDPPKPKPEPPKPEPPKPPEPPKKTAKELREERMRKMRENAKVVKGRPPAPRPPVVGTGVNLEKDWMKLMQQGYRPGAVTQLASSETQRCISLIRAAFYAKWERPAWTSSLRDMHLEVRFGNGGKVLGYRLVQGSGDAEADRSVTSAASRVMSVSGLSSDFLSQNPTVVVRFIVTPE